MAAIKQLAVVARSGTGKGAARSVRREGRVPGVIYGGGEKPEPVSVDFRELNKLVYAGQFLTTIFELEIGDRKERVLPRDFQLDVVTDKPVHVDFLRLRPGSRVRIAVPVHVVNREASPGVKKGGAVNLVMHSIELLAPADAIPEAVTVDLTGLDFQDSVHVTAVKMPDGCRPANTSTDFTVVTIVPPTVYQEEAPAAVATSTAAPAVAAGAPPAKGAATAAPAKGAASAPAAARSGQGRGRARQAGRQEIRAAFAPKLAGPSARQRAGFFHGHPLMILIAGLGNPGARHARNRHNIGFMAIEAIAAAQRIGPFRSRFQGLVADGTLGATRAALLMPQTFMNESGRSVGEAMRFYKLGLASVIVVHDELDLAPAKARVKVGGGNAGHNGLRSITAHIGNDYKRLRLGIGHPGDKMLVYPFVLGDFSKEEMRWVDAICEATARAAELLASGEDARFQNKVHLAVEAAGFGGKAPE